MADVTVEVFYSTTCPNCPAQKELAERFADRATVRMTDVARSQGRAKRHGVRAVPTTVVSGPGVDEKMGFTGVMAEDDLATAIDVAAGAADRDALEPPSLIDRIRAALP